MFWFKKLINNYGSYIKYLLILFAFVVMIWAIKSYVYFLSVQETIVSVANKSDSVKRELNYAKNFQEKYLASDYGYLFLAHDNSMIFKWEWIIVFKHQEDLNNTWFNADLTHIPYRPTEEEERRNLEPGIAWNLYIKELREKID